MEREIKVKTKYDSGFRLKCKNFLDHPLTEVFMLLMTVVALFITDSNQILGTKEDDLIVQVSGEVVLHLTHRERGRINNVSSNLPKYQP